MGGIGEAYRARKNMDAAIFDNQSKTHAKRNLNVGSDAMHHFFVLKAWLCVALIYYYTSHAKQ